MPDALQDSLPRVLSAFRLEGDPEAVERWGSGHIHDTFVSRVRTERGVVRFVLQRINRGIFLDPEGLMENVRRVTAHLREKAVVAGEDPDRRVLTLVPAVSGRVFHLTEGGDYWRTYRFIEGARTHDTAQSPRHVFEVGRAFARFQQRVADLPPPPLHETLPRFGDTLWRFAEFEEALDQDRVDRAAQAAPEIDFVLDRRDLAGLLPDLLQRKAVPLRVIHYDTKINNVMIDDQSGEGVCVIDLDTVMQGSALYDFGDAVRLGACRAAEDERDLSRVSLDPGLFESLTQGYLELAREFLVPTEIDHLVQAARLVTFIIGVRFLTDYLAGDVYFKTARERHNLDRCRTQFALVRDIEAHAEALQAVVERYRA